uniref:Small ribosomal subunit protein uS14c n=1 Tax=Verdigellas peltata TaxID=542676 RepID=A0A161KB39_9VIRI|nr:ribosomal protein S14 [Verdigellas peltata]CZF96699.1 ribosomal protein S14 [Verdigellas peltata]
MAKKSLITREKKRQLLSLKYFEQRKNLNNKFKNSTSISEKLKIHAVIQKLPRNSNFTRLHNRCNITGRPKGYYKYFGFSRHIIRELAHKGMLPGVKKSSW